MVLSELNIIHCKLFEDIQYVTDKWFNPVLGALEFQWTQAGILHDNFHM